MAEFRTNTRPQAVGTRLDRACEGGCPRPHTLYLGCQCDHQLFVFVGEENGHTDDNTSSHKTETKDGKHRHRLCYQLTCQVIIYTVSIDHIFIHISQYTIAHLYYSISQY